MKKKHLVPLVFFPLLMHSQDILWEKSYGGKHADYLFDAQPTADYGFILAGSSLSDKSGNKTDNNHGDLDYWIWKMDEKGELDWQKSIGGSGFDLLQSIKNTSDGGFILAGTSSSSKDFQKKDSCRGITDFWVVKLNAKGEEQWQRTIGGSGQDELVCAFQTKDGGYMLGGSSSSSPAEEKNAIHTIPLDAKPDLCAKSEKSRGNMDYWIVKLDKAGVVEWQKTYGGEYADVLRSMEQTTDGGYTLGGYSNSSRSGDKSEANSGIGDYWILKIDSVGKIEWQKTYGGNGDNQLYVIHQTEDGGYIAGGNSNSTSPLTTLGGNVSNGTDYWVLKLDEKGEVLWSKTYDFGKVDILTSLVENKDHTYLIGGYAQSENKQPREGLVGKATSLVNKDKEGINDYIALKIDKKGEETWKKTVGSGGEDILRKLIETRDGGYLMAGTSNSNASKDKNGNIGGNDFWVVKLKDKTKLEKVKTSVEAIPNPAQAFTNIIIGYDFEDGTATVVDIAGRILQRFPVKERTVPIDLSLYPEGIYVVNIKTNVQSDGVKVIKKGKN
ncbi:T9SS type A sorting domain-containing protein [Flavobacterium aestivum]|uniref:T9SS type A sorting domain-containing protein n=1 Tax=Flavobacterium aestivum TaxID=3003257 RepID=UPI0024822275|nr:T9SS type A sorting domain-containing protein [Flavobacterium aestivum]